MKASPQGLPVHFPVLVLLSAVAVIEYESFPPRTASPFSGVSVVKCGGCYRV